MDKKKVLELAEKAYNSKEVCQEWKDEILKVFPELKKGFEANKWYKDNECPSRIFYVNENRKIEYGFTSYKRWSNMISYDFDCERDVEATKEEVEEALIREAKKRGFKEGVKVVKPIFGTAVLGCGVWRYTEDFGQKDCMLLLGGSAVFYMGKWAEIVEERKELTKEQIEKELGYKIKIV